MAWTACGRDTAARDCPGNVTMAQRPVHDSRTRSDGSRSTCRLAADHEVHVVWSGEAVLALEALQCLRDIVPGGVLFRPRNVRDQRGEGGVALTDHGCHHGCAFQPQHGGHAYRPHVDEAGITQDCLEPDGIDQGTNTAWLILPVRLAAMPGEDI